MFEARRIQELESKRDLHKPGPSPTSAGSTTRCVVHGSGFLPTTSSTRDDETCRVDGSVHELQCTTTTMQIKLLTLAHCRFNTQVM